MTFIPAFKIGLWNAWILMVLLLAAGIVPLYIDNEKTEKRSEGEPTGSELSKATRTAYIITHIIIMPCTLIYSIFLPLKLGTFWLYIGLLIYLFGLVMTLMFSIAFATAPLDKPISKGVYAISRHPGYFGFFLGCIGIGIACASWVFLLFALVWIVSLNYGVVEEESILIEKYGDVYREYLNRTPRWIGIPKSN
jgi:protein-S-isoprenylcysteine O-methyltransferase Ste14